MNGYPKTLNHPSYQKGSVKAVPMTSPITGRTITDYYGTPDRFPPVTVKNEDEEEYYRARGYRAPGEAGESMKVHHEYPKMLHHPQYEAAVPDEQVAERKDGRLTVTVIKGKPAKFPPVIVNSPEEVEQWLAKGYEERKSDPSAFETAQASPYVPGRVTEEWPKMVNGQIVDPRPKESGIIEYPKWVHGVIVKDSVEEMEIRAKHEPKPAVVANNEVASDPVKRRPGRPRKSAAAA